MQVRTRFAPSPTGSMHVGNARTAIFNWLFARHHGGKFILRIEDTDLERSTRENEDKLIEDLKWLGLDWDEGPFRQSERLNIYKEYAEKLIAEKKAFYCFCTDEELEKKREQAKQEGRDPIYDGACRHLSADEVAKNKAAGKPFSIRFVVKQRDIVHCDLIKGEVVFKENMFGDFVLIRSNSMPVYNYAVVVDDALMEISHVIRAEEHLPNTARQILLYEGLGFKMPQFGHTALILAEDGSKLSKRHGATSVEEYRTKGFFPEGIFNYLSILGWTPPEEGREKLAREELIKYFGLEKVSTHSGKFDLNKLNWLNGEYLKEKNPEDMKPLLIKYLKEEYDLSLFSPDKLEKMLALLLPRLSYLEQVKDEAKMFFMDLKYELPEEWKGEQSVKLLKRFREEIEKTPQLTEDFMKELLKTLGKELNLKGKALFMPLRFYTTGHEHGPDLNIILSIIGKDRVLKRLSLQGITS